MAKQLQVLNLSLNTARHVPTDELLPSYYLQSHLLSCALMDGQPYFSEGALAQSSHDLVGANALLRLGSRFARGRARGILSIRTGFRRLYGIVAARVSALSRWRRRLLRAMGQGHGELLIIKGSSGRHDERRRGEEMADWGGARDG